MNSVMGAQVSQNLRVWGFEHAQDLNTHFVANGRPELHSAECSIAQNKDSVIPHSCCTLCYGCTALRATLPSEQLQPQPQSAHSWPANIKLPTGQHGHSRRSNSRQDTGMLVGCDFRFLVCAHLLDYPTVHGAPVTCCSPWEYSPTTVASNKHMYSLLVLPKRSAGGKQSSSHLSTCPLKQSVGQGCYCSMRDTMARRLRRINRNICMYRLDAEASLALCMLVSGQVTLFRA
jgi:hypothetical protein